MNDSKQQGLTVSQAASPLTILGDLSVSEVAYYARAASGGSLKRNVARPSRP